MSECEIEWIKISLSNLPGRREPAACRPKMSGKTRQGDEWRKPCISNMPGRRQNMPPKRQKYTYKKYTRETSAIYHVCQTCQGDGKAEIEWSKTSMSNLPGRREPAACRPKMPGKTRQGDEWRKPCISNMSGRHLSIYQSIYQICLSIYLSICPYIRISIYQSIYLSIPRSISLALYPSIHPSILRE